MYVEDQKNTIRYLGFEAIASCTCGKPNHREDATKSRLRRLTAKLQRGVETMKISTLRGAGLAVVALSAASLATVQPASARNGGAVAAGVIGGLAVGGLVGSALANQNNGYAYGGYAAPAYAPPPPPVYDAGCYFTRQATYDPYGNFAGYRRVRVCE